VLAVVSKSSTATRRLLIGRPLPKRIALPVFASSVPWQLHSSERLKTPQPQSAPGDARRGFPG